MFQSLENVFLHLCLDDQNRNQQNLINGVTADALNEASDDVENQNIPLGDVTSVETPRSEIRKKELVKNRKLKTKKCSMMTIFLFSSCITCKTSGSRLLCLSSYA